MDNKTQNLDPALKATYERVMGTNVAAPTPSPFPAPTLTPPPTPPSSPALQPAVTVPQGSNDIKVVTGSPNATKVVAGGGKVGGRLSPALVFVAIALFFAIYTFVWLFVFKVNIPFIPKLF